jgi:hypothetical protein
MASAIDNTPENKNFLNPMNFRFSIKRAPHVNFFIQKVNIPSISVPPTEYPNPLVRIPYSGEHMDYGTLAITFKVDEDLENYLEIHNWVRGLGKPYAYKEYADLKSQNPIMGGGLKSDITLLILNSTKLPIFEITYTDAFPISLSEILFDTTSPDISYIEATAEFKYTLFEITES